MNEQNNEMSSQAQETIPNPPKRKRNGLFTLFACIMTAVIVVLAMNIGQQLSKGVEPKSSKTENTPSEQKPEEVADNCSANTPNNATIIFDSSKSINNTNGKNYTLFANGNSGISAATDTTQKVLKFSYTPARVVKEYFLTWNSTVTTVTTDEIKFEKKIVDLFFGGFGQTNSGDTLFILLEDGTIEYIPIVHMFNHIQASAVSYGTIKDVNGVVKFAIADEGDGVTTLGIKNDGSFYDLGNILSKTGNY